MFLYSADIQSQLQQFLAIIPLLVKNVPPECGAVLPHFVCQQVFTRAMINSPGPPYVVVRQPTCYAACLSGFTPCEKSIKNPIIWTFLPTAIKFYFDCNSSDIHVGGRRVYPEEGWSFEQFGNIYEVPCISPQWGTPWR